MAQEIHNSDAERDKSSDPVALERLPIAVFESMPSPFFPQARMIYPREIKTPEPAPEAVAPKPTA